LLGVPLIDSAAACWSDFATWLEERGMADDSYEPVQEAEGGVAWRCPSIAKESGPHPDAGFSSLKRDMAGIGIWTWADSKRVAERAKIKALAKNLGHRWDFDAGHVELLGSYRRLDEFDDSSSARVWATARVDELRQVGLFTLIESFGRDTEGDEAEAD
jgi:hypothetical protein